MIYDDFMMICDDCGQLDAMEVFCFSKRASRNHRMALSEYGTARLTALRLPVAISQ